MSGFLTQTPFGWLAAALGLAYLLGRLAGWYMDRGPLTDIELRCSAVDDELNRGLILSQVVDGSGWVEATYYVDDDEAEDKDEAIESWAAEGIEDLEFWLTARDKFEQGS